MVQFLFQICYCKKKLQIVKEAASMQSTDMAIVTKLESAININEPQSMDSPEIKNIATKYE
jgi:hypothetical protein